MKRFYVFISLFIFLIFLNCPQATEEKEKEKQPAKWGTQSKIISSDIENEDNFWLFGINIRRLCNCRSLS